MDQPRSIKFKGTADLVTNTDRASEAAILEVRVAAVWAASPYRNQTRGCRVQVLQSAVPDHGFLGEEGGMSGNADSEFLWAIDPLDGKHCSRWSACPAGSSSAINMLLPAGTTNFASSFPSFAVSVAGEGPPNEDSAP